MTLARTMAMAQPTSLPVLIIGSGLGGLTLAHSLQNRQIPYRIFERDGAESQRAQGYRISIDSGGASGLKAAVTPSLFARFEETCAESHRPGGRVNALTGQLERGGVIGILGTGGWEMIRRLAVRFLGKRMGKFSLSGAVWWFLSWFRSSPSLLPVAPNGATRDYQVDRRVLRSVLLQGQTDHILFDSEFSHYALDPDKDAVTAHFSNGSSATGSLLVGADGVGSKVAAQLLGSRASKPLDLGARIIYGKTPLTPLVEQTLNSTLRHGTSFVVDDRAAESGVRARRKLMVCESIRFTHPDHPENYVFWALSGHKQVYGIDDSTPLAELQGEPAREITDRLTTDWHPSIKVILDEQAVEETAILRMTTSDPGGAPVWDTEKRVTLLGDAIHCMPPTGGQGANSAMRDAAMLGQILGESRYSGSEVTAGWSKEVIKRYEDAVRYQIGDVVGLACIGVSGILDMDVDLIASR